MKRCQKCFSENDNLMSFCWECGTPLPDLFETTPKTQEFPTESSPTLPTVDVGDQAVKTIEAGRFNLVTNNRFAKRSTGGRTFWLIAVIGVLLLLPLIFAAGVAVYYLIPGEKEIVTVKPTPTVIPLEKTPTPAPSFTPPIAPTKQGSFNISADQGWQLSDIFTVANEEFSTRVSGKINLAGIKNNVTSDGVNDPKTKSRRIYPEFPTGALLMRTRYADGNFSNVTSLTTNGSNGTWLNYPDERGKLEFCINDNEPADNSGQFVVAVKFTKIAPPAKK